MKVIPLVQLGTLTIPDRLRPMDACGRNPRPGPTRAFNPPIMADLVLPIIFWAAIVELRRGFPLTPKRTFYVLKMCPKRPKFLVIIGGSNWFRPKLYRSGCKYACCIWTVTETL